MAERKQNKYCIFCGRSEKQVDFLIESELGLGGVCSDCAGVINKMMQEQNRKNVAKEVGDYVLKSPSQIKAYLDQYVIGQERAKKVLSVAVYNHF